MLVASPYFVKADTISVTAPPEAVSFIDGDNLKLFGENMRLIDIDAAERGQTCNAASGGTWDCANAATEHAHTNQSIPGPIEPIMKKATITIFQ